MQPPKCPHCGKVEWSHLCSGAALSEIGRRIERKRPRLPGKLRAKDLDMRDPPMERSTAKLRIEELEAEVVMLKRELAKANAKLDAKLAEANALSNGVSNVSNAKSNKPAFDKKAYQRELMRKRRAAAKA